MCLTKKGWGMVEQVRAEVFVYVVLSVNPTSDQFMEFSSVFNLG
jgi:hypothetical protein